MNPLPCPFCGKRPDMDDLDTIYPTGKWRHHDSYKVYLSFDNEAFDGYVFKMHCPENSGGCGAEISGDSKEEALMKWNMRNYHRDSHN